MSNIKACDGIHKAEITDLARLTEIYNQAILTQRCTCDIRTFTVRERQLWFSEHQTGRFPIFVYEMKGKVVGYSYISPYRPGRKALCDVCEISYYIDFDYHRRGIGSRLMEYTIQKAVEKGFVNMIAILLSCNSGSIALLKKFGFSEWGALPEIAQMDNALYSHLYYGKKLKK
ncbi:MAG: GNAT family N-acetyltransferase [Clostridium sp.]|uniref:GNAT family N-acetyltransferase n=1 Tax=Clostridium sp. TaxID=1506 RepID=UPI0025B98A75|nr:GNAT family N-acetyltransferase [Clostridium sp.]MCH3963357.1 GNAT family N-acetyltransferase [Clostridium sp.]MCI1716775.1 GNAT family N-acetyltransferase [Clostridium sp.]MCI1801041.1 GNAT family N-acetyltransferase [Clostridium sp.]MCI1814961.1 GNAT family N-acetyltransferase [Clostridium sp.]MCI1871862.1 GNAT family N-acetyltransferase [Clostridium sp.]